MKLNEKLIIGCLYVLLLLYIQYEINLYLINSDLIYVSLLLIIPFSFVYWKIKKNLLQKENEVRLQKIK